MKILILFRWTIDPMQGGVERVYHNLAGEFARMGVEISAHYRVSSDYDKDNAYHSIFLSKFREDEKVRIREEICDIIKQYGITHVIMPYQIPLYFFVCEEVAKHCKLFVHVHNDPRFLFGYPIKLLKKMRFSKGAIDTISNAYHRWVKFGPSFSILAKNGATIVLLSEAFKDDFKKAVRVTDENIISIANPFIIEKSAVLTPKEKILLYVGRLSEKQKRVSSLLKIWGFLQNKISDYSLEIVGDGPSKTEYIRYAKENHLERVTFRGFATPTEYYRKSPVCLMTSNYEGFSMVLVEAMSYGAVPFAFDSYPSLGDIIDDGINGYKVTPFDEHEYADKILSFLALPDEKKNVIRANAIQKASMFDVKVIARKWIELMQMA